MAYGKWTCWYW